MNSFRYAQSWREVRKTEKYRKLRSWAVDAVMYLTFGYFWWRVALILAGYSS